MEAKTTHQYKSGIVIRGEYIADEGYACVSTMAGPWDAIEPMRRVCKWIIDETCDPAQIPPLWEDGLLIHGTVAA